MPNEYTIHIDYTGEKDLAGDLVMDIDLDDLLTVSFETDEHLEDSEVREMFGDEVLEDMSTVLNDVLPLNVDETKLEIGQIERN